MSNVEHYSTDIRKGVRAGNLTLHDRLTRGRLMSQPVERFGVISGMIETAENLAKDYGISREAADAYAARSHQRAAAAWAQGLFDASGRASCRERVCQYVLMSVVAVTLTKQNENNRNSTIIANEE